MGDSRRVRGASGGGRRRRGVGSSGFFRRRRSSLHRVVRPVEPPAARDDLRPASPRERRGGRGPELRGRLAERRRRSSLRRRGGPDESGAGHGGAGQLEGLAPPVRPRGVSVGAPNANPRRGRPRHERRGLREPLRPRAGRHLRGSGRTDRVRSMSIIGRRWFGTRERFATSVARLRLERATCIGGILNAARGVSGDAPRTGDRSASRPWVSPAPWLPAPAGRRSAALRWADLKSASALTTDEFGFVARGRAQAATRERRGGGGGRMDRDIPRLSKSTANPARRRTATKERRMERRGNTPPSRACVA